MTSFRTMEFPQSSDSTTTDSPHLPADEIRDALHVQLARIGQAVANPIRFHLLTLLSQGAKSVDTLSAQTGRSFASVSAHLKVLRQAHLVAARREGRHKFYRVESDDVLRLCDAMQQTAIHLLPEVRELRDTYYCAPETLTALSPEELLEAAKSGEIVLVDLRSKEEFDAGHLPHARSLPFDDLDAQVGVLPHDMPIIAYCRGPWCLMGVRGVAALRRHGFDARRFPFGVAEFRARGLSADI